MDTAGHVVTESAKIPEGDASERPACLRIALS